MEDWIFKNIAFLGVIAVFVGCGQGYDYEREQGVATSVVNAPLAGPAVADGVPQDLVIATYAEVLDAETTVKKQREMRFASLVDETMIWATTADLTTWKTVGDEEVEYPALPRASPKVCVSLPKRGPRKPQGPPRSGGGKRHG